MYIQIVSSLQLSLAGFKNFPVHMHLMIWIQIHSKETKPTLCAAIPVHCSIRVWTRFCYRCTSSNSKISGFTVHKVSDSLQVYFFSLESRSKNIRNCCQICQMRMDGGRIQKEKVADSKISGYKWMAPNMYVHCIYSDKKTCYDP